MPIYCDRCKKECNAAILVTVRNDLIRLCYPCTQPGHRAEADGLPSYQFGKKAWCNIL